MARSKVAVVSATPETVLEDYARAMALAGFSSALSSWESDLVLLLDLRWSRFQPGAGPMPWQLEAVLRALQEQGVDSTRLRVVAKRRAEVDPATALRTHHAQALLEERGIPLEEIPGVTHRRAPEARLPELEQWHGGAIDTPELTADHPLLALSGLSTHLGFGIAGAVGAIAGQFLDSDLLREDPRAPHLLAEAFAFARETHPGFLAVLDATTCGLGPGPRRVRPSSQNLVLVSPDPVAADAVAARILGLDPRRIPYLAACQDRGLGSVRLEDIDFVGEMPASLEENLHAPPGLPISERLAALGARRALAAPRRRLRGLLRDQFWYPIRGRRWRRLWSRTPWGRLFAEYAMRGRNA